MLRYFWSNEETTPVDGLIDTILDDMNTKGPGDDEYATLMAYLERLYELKAKDRRQPVSRDTIATCVTNLAGILLIVAYEQKHVMRSIGLNHIIRLGRPNVPTN